MSKKKKSIGYKFDARVVKAAKIIEEDYLKRCSCYFLIT